MKNIVISIACLLAASLTFAGGNNISKEGGVLGNSMFLNVGFGMPKFISTEFDGKLTHYKFEDAKDLGKQISLEFGNQFNFVNASNFGFGMKVSWIYIGYSSTSLYKSLPNGSAFDIKLLKISPMLTYAIQDNFGVDLYFDLAPSATMLIDKNGIKSDDVVQWSGGISYAPGARIRYAMFSVGYDYTINTGLIGSGTIPYTSTEISMKLKTYNSRIYLGLNF